MSTTEVPQPLKPKVSSVPKIVIEDPGIGEFIRDVWSDIRISDLELIPGIESVERKGNTHIRIYIDHRWENHIDDVLDSIKRIAK
jgi:hypothetical protein